MEARIDSQHSIVASQKAEINTEIPFSQLLALMGFSKDYEPDNMRIDEQITPCINEFYHYYLIIQYICYHCQSSSAQQLPLPILELNFCLERFNHYMAEYKQAESGYHSNEIKQIAASWAIAYMELLGILIQQNQDTLEHYIPILKFRDEGILNNNMAIDIHLSDTIFTNRTFSDKRVEFYVNFLMGLLKEKECELFDYNHPVNRGYYIVDIFYVSASTLINLTEILLEGKQYQYIFDLLKIFPFSGIVKFKLYEHAYKNNLKINEIYKKYYKTKEGDEILFLREENLEESMINCIEERWLGSEFISNATHTINDFVNYVNKKIQMVLSSNTHKKSLLGDMKEYINVVESDYSSHESNLLSDTESWLSYYLHSKHDPSCSPIMFKWLLYRLVGTFACFPPVFKYVQQQTLIGNESAADIESELTAPIPFVLRVLLPSSSLRLYQNFFIKFEQLNRSNEERFRRDFVSFISLNTVKFINLHEIMDDRLFAFLRGFMASSVLPLERFFNSLTLIEGEYYELVKEIISSHKKMKQKDIENIFLLISNLKEFIYVNGDDAEKDMVNYSALSGKVKRAKSFMDIEEILRKHCVELYCKKLGISYSENMDMTAIMTELTMKQLAQLFVGRKAMENDIYKEVFDEILRVDLSPECSFATFTTATEQDSQIGRKLAEHNQVIIERLKAASYE